MKVLYFGTYSVGEGYPRNSVIIRGLRENGVDVVECHAELWHGAKDKIAGARSLAGLARIGPRLITTYLSLIRQFSNAPDFDLIIVGYTGQFDIFLAKVLNIRRKKPLVLDAFISLYDTIVKDRGLTKSGTLKANLLWWLDKIACSLADLVLLDTKAHIDYFVQEFGLPKNRFARVLVGGDEVVNRSGTGNGAPEAKEGSEAGFNVLYFGTYIPLHGIEYIVKAAKIVAADRDIRFTLVGTGQLLKAMQRLAVDIGCKNIEFVSRWSSAAELAVYIRRANVCLGIFGTTEKASRVIPCKIFDCMAFGKPIVTADTPAAQELLKNGITAILVEAGNPAAIAASILKLKTDHALSRKIGETTKEVYEEKCLPGAIGRALCANLANILRTAS
jgi:glycosyltransferase involved in cell wall biosynthesis